MAPRSSRGVRHTTGRPRPPSPPRTRLRQPSCGRASAGTCRVPRSPRSPRGASAHRGARARRRAADRRRAFFPCGASGTPWPPGSISCARRVWNPHGGLWCAPRFARPTPAGSGVTCWRLCRSRGKDARVALERTEIVLPARGRFDLRATVLSRGPQGLPPYRWKDGAPPLLERAEQLPDGSVHLLTIRPDRRGVVLQVTGPDAREIEMLAPLAASVRRALALDFDPAPFQRACATDPLLRPVARLGLGRVLHGTSAFEDVVGALACGGSASPEGMRALARLAALGPRCPARRSLRAFPAAAAVARIDARRLRVRTGLGQLAASVRALAREASRGRRDLRAIDHLSMTAAARALAGVRGLG